jgi:3-deoxy-manno-octulosonate cytidylyltransferase (CMP-KDO synthetase)
MRTLSRPTVGLNQVIGLIPARWNSSRFEGKPLAEICGIPMIHRVYNQCLQCESLDRIVVLTDDERINQYCASNEIPCVVIDEPCETGTDRCAKAIELLDGDYFVNIQGDEPLIDPYTIDTLVRTFLENPDHWMAGNAYVKMHDDLKLHDKNVVKVVFDVTDSALFFSRLPIPYPKGDMEQYYQQLGLYVFTRESLERFSDLERLPLERSEEIEMLRFLEHDYKVRMVEVTDVGLSVDTPHDLKEVERYINDIQYN